MNNSRRLTGLNVDQKEDWQKRVDLAAVFRLAAYHNWHEAVANHFSLAVSADGKQFLMNPRWKHFSHIRASDLLLLQVDDYSVLERPDAPDITAWCIHARLHALAPQARCVLHLHPPYATALTALVDPEIRPIEQNTARFFRRIAYDNDFGGMANTEEEGDRLVRVLGNKSVMMMGNHGVLVASSTVAEAYDCIYYLERACQTQVLAYSTGKTLKIMSDTVAERTAQDWEDYAESAFMHFEEMKKILHSIDPSYAD